MNTEQKVVRPDGWVPPLTYKNIWDTLSKINVSENTTAKQGFNYLSWTWAWQTLMEHYPQAQLSFTEERDEVTHTVMIYCTITIDDLSRTMWLPVMDHRNKAIPNPDTRMLSDSRQRAWVKTAALFGLGLHIYQGEAIPDAMLKEEISADDLASIEKLLTDLKAKPEPLVNWIGTGMQPGIKSLDQLKAIHLEKVVSKLTLQLSKKVAKKEEKGDE